MKLLIDPHGDDAVLFAAYTCIVEKLHVVVTHPAVPVYEIAHGIGALGSTCSISHNGEWKEWFTKSKPQPQVVYVPAPSIAGHDDHNEAATVAKDLFGDRVRYYLTYAPRGQRDRNGTEVIPPAGAVAKKLRALSCYESQIEQESTRPWFTSLLDMREWISES